MQPRRPPGTPRAWRCACLELRRRVCTTARIAQCAVRTAHALPAPGLAAPTHGTSYDNGITGGVITMHDFQARFFVSRVQLQRLLALYACVGRPQMHACMHACMPWPAIGRQSPSCAPATMPHATHVTHRPRAARTPGSDRVEQRQRLLPGGRVALQNARACSEPSGCTGAAMTEAGVWPLHGVHAWAAAGPRTSGATRGSLCHHMCCTHVHACSTMTKSCSCSPPPCSWRLHFRPWWVSSDAARSCMAAALRSCALSYMLHQQHVHSAHTT